MALCFVPLTPALLAAWPTRGVLPGEIAAFTVSAAMATAFELTDPASEEAEYTALLIASLAGLLRHGERLVAVAEATVLRPGSDADFGEVVVADLAWSRVTALFADEPGMTGPVAAAVAVSGLSLAQAWEHPAVAALLAECDLLWYGPGEWGSLTGS